MKVALRAFSFLLPLALIAAPPKQFRIFDVGIHQTEDGPLVEAGTTFVPGEVIFFSCRIDGYQVTAKKVNIQYQFSAVDPAGVPVVEPATGKFDTELAAQDKEWKPKVRQSVLVPPLAESGVYKMHFSAKDELSGATASAEATFEVKGHDVQPSETLVVRNFRFYRVEDESAPPLTVASYRPGDPVWARFDLAGYKMGPGNQREVAYTVTVIGPDGRVLLAPRDPEVDKGSSFYPMKYVPCVISLNLQPSIRPDEYTIVVSAQDRIGNQTFESKQTFRVE